MFKNYIKIALRNLWKNPGYSFINIGGLAIGISCCLLIGIYVSHEWNYDTFHEKSDRLYRLTYEHRIGEDLPPATPEEYMAWGSAAIAPLLEQDFPEVEHTVRLSGRHQQLISRGDEAFQEERYFFADPSFFDVFSFSLIQGDPETALVQPNSIILTESSAVRYFGEEDPLGKLLQLGSEETPLTVTGVMADIPSNTHLDFNMLLSMSTFENESRAIDRAFVFDSWGYVDFFTYVLLEENTSAEALEEKLPAFVQKYVGDELQDPPQTLDFNLEPITEAYLSVVSGFQPGPKGNEANLYIFSFIGFFILLIACVNFMNLATAYSTTRAKEVGIRKSIGAKRGGLIWQFISEAILLAGTATVLALAISQIALPFFQELSGKEIPGAIFTGIHVIAILIIGTVAVGLLAGFYPAFVLSAFRPVQVLKGNFSSSGSGAALRKGLVVFQFTAAIVLIIGTLVVRNQLQYLQEQPLGFQDRQQLVLDYGADALVNDNIDNIKQEFERVPGVQNVSATRSIPGGYFPHATSQIETAQGAMQQINPGLYEVDAEFLNQIEVEVAAGRLFSEDYSTDAEEALIINDVAAEQLGYSDPSEVIGKRFQQWGREGEVIGVVKNFNHESLQNEIRPLTFRVAPWLNYVVLQVSTDDISATLSDVEATWREVAPHRPFLFSFLDQSFDAQYQTVEKFGALFGIFTALAIFVACLGLFGLAAYAAQQRTKEIGVRKVLGATVRDIIALLSKDFVKLVCIGFVIAIPIAWYVMNQWLADFAYRIDIGWRIFAIAGAIAILVALITVSWQSLRAALMNPINSLRSE
ncbi:ABC transporter permease [Rhodohalobacter sp. 614A]|uniref:ABC transporter permease n=1 Tax=Rhodohalobacter sp. 614A TaxID=2908649 RepID=UPI001F299D3B|nr:ABC transporter permease [Rhodohalobacter sp. 614A]